MTYRVVPGGTLETTTGGASARDSAMTTVTGSASQVTVSCVRPSCSRRSATAVVEAGATPAAPGEDSTPGEDSASTEGSAPGEDTADCEDPEADGKAGEDAGPSHRHTYG